MCDYEGQWAGQRMGGSVKYCGSAKSPYWGADVRLADGTPGFFAYDIPEGSEDPVPVQVVHSFGDPKWDRYMDGVGRFLAGDPPHFILANVEGTYIITLKPFKGCPPPLP
jgi:hypothetical protein